MSSARVLVVDDDPGVLRAMLRVLQPHYTVCCADTPSKGAALASSFDPDIAICDIQMPQMSGFELLDRLRSAAPDIDVILMTGSITDQDTHLIRALRERAFYFILKPFDRDVLLALVERCLEMRRLRQAERRHLTRMREELLAAQAFQQAMFAPTHGECSGSMIDVLCRPCSEVGGDFYDYALTPQGDLAFILADVRGHGVPAALMTATVKTIFRTAALRGSGPAELAASLVEALEFFGADQFITAFAGWLEPGSHRLRYVNAGHPAALLVSSENTLQLLHAGGPLLCAMFDADSWPEESIAMAASSRLLLHTDGFCTGLCSAHSDFASQLLKAMLGGGSGQDVLGAMLRIAQDHPDVRGLPADDVTLMLIQQTPSARARS